MGTVQRKAEEKKRWGLGEKDNRGDPPLSMESVPKARLCYLQSEIK